MEESENGDRAIGSRAQDRDDVSRSKSETPTSEGKNRKRRAGEKFEYLEGLVEKKMVKLQQSDNASRRMEEKSLEVEE